MSYLICHMEKLKANAIRGIQSHIKRTYISKTNPDINYLKTEFNYSFLESEKNLLNDIKATVQDKAPKTKTIRKDAVLVNSFVITSDNLFFQKLSEQQQKQFFYDVALFFHRRYDGNMVFAEVHLDEKTPHMHLGIVPIINEKLCAKELFNRTELKKLQTDLAKEVGTNYGLKRGKEGSNAKHLSELRYKEETLKRDIELLEQTKNRLENEIKTLQEQSIHSTEFKKDFSFNNESMTLDEKIKQAKIKQQEQQKTKGFTFKNSKEKEFEY